MGCQVRGQDLRQVTPFGQEDDDECRGHDPSTRRRLPLDQGLFVSSLGCFSHGQSGTHEEHEGHDAVQHPVRKQVKEGDADGGSDHHVDNEGSGGSQPYCSRIAASRHDQRSEHGLVGQFPDEDDRGERQVVGRPRVSWCGSVERLKGIEPSSSVWKTEALPLSYSRRSWGPLGGEPTGVPATAEKIQATGAALVHRNDRNSVRQAADRRPYGPSRCRRAFRGRALRPAATRAVGRR